MKFNTNDTERKWTSARLPNNKLKIDICMGVWIEKFET